MATILVAIPIGESIADLLCTYIESLKMKPTKKIIEGNAELSAFQNEGVELSPCVSYCDISEPYEYYDDDEEDW